MPRPRPLTLSSCRCPLCRSVTHPALLTTHPQLGPLCDDCFALIEDTNYILVPSIPLVSNFTDLEIPPHADTIQEDPS